MENFNEDVDMSDIPEFQGQYPPPLSSRDLDQLQYHISLQEIGQKLQRAANLAYPNDKRMRYTAVYVLLLCWEDEDPNLPVSIELDELRSIFIDKYCFNVEVWNIPSQGSHKKLNQKVLDFVELGGDSKDELKIVYYGGHGMLAHNRQSSWASRPDANDPSYRTVKWNGIQHALEEAESDALILLDCCASGTANTDVGCGVTELIAACGFNTSANPVGPDSFTRALITELEILSSAPSFTVGSLFNKILCRIQNWMPSGREMQKPPLHVVLTQNSKLPQSIQLSRLRPPHVLATALDRLDQPTNQKSLGPSQNLAECSSHVQTQSVDSQAQSSVSSPESTGSSLQQDSVTSSTSSLFSDKDMCPRIAITIRLKESLAKSDLSVDLFADWIRMMPVLADKIKIEAGFASCSTLLIVSLPVALWCYLPDDPALSVIGIVKSTNLLSNGGSPLNTDVDKSCNEKFATFAGDTKSAAAEATVLRRSKPTSGIISPVVLEREKAKANILGSLGTENFKFGQQFSDTLIVPELQRIEQSDERQIPEMTTLSTGQDLSVNFEPPEESIKVFGSTAQPSYSMPIWWSAYDMSDGFEDSSSVSCPSIASVGISSMLWDSSNSSSSGTRSSLSIPGSAYETSYDYHNGDTSYVTSYEHPYKQDQTYGPFTVKDQTQTDADRPTPSTLGWRPDTNLWKIYTFVVPWGQEPYLQLLPGCEERLVTPQRVYLDSPITENKGKINYSCQFPGSCNGKQIVFTRPADLERHYRMVHASSDQKTFACDYSGCQSAKGGFTIKDHYRNHLRNYHKEDVMRANGEKSFKDKKMWLAKQNAERKISPKWWRCARCLKKVHVGNDGWECPGCKADCEPERREAREKMLKEANVTEQSTSLYAPVCTCNGTAWIESSHVSGSWEACPHCQTQEPSTTAFAYEVSSLDLSQ